jgi:hypothetical protein
MFKQSFRVRKGEAGSFDIPKRGPASVALEATRMFTRQQYQRWSEEDDRALRTMSEAGESVPKRLMLSWLRLLKRAAQSINRNPFQQEPSSSATVGTGSQG